MQSLITTYKNSGNLHHAYIVEGEIDNIHPQLCQFCEKELQIKIRGNPNFIFETRDKFIISDAKKLQELQLNKKAEKEKQIFIISFNFITREAQNALLKVLEEPTTGTHIFFITPSVNVFLPTVLSRVEIISDQLLVISYQEEVEKFLESNISERLKRIEKLVKDIREEKISKNDAIQFTKNLTQILHQTLNTSNEVSGEKRRETYRKIEELEKVINFLYDQGSSVKILLEHVALIV
jgi:DNA polymerase III subunit delta'